MVGVVEVEQRMEIIPVLPVVLVVLVVVVLLFGVAELVVQELVDKVIMVRLV